MTNEWVFTSREGCTASRLESELGRLETGRDVEWQWEWEWEWEGGRRAMRAG